MSRLFLTALAFATFEACTFDSAIATDQVVTCSASEQKCPAGFTCVVRLERCVASTDRDPPVISQQRLEPRTGKLGTRFEVSFSLSEAPITTPSVYASFAGGRRADFTFVRRDELQFWFDYVVDAQAEPGAARLTIAATDTSGNDARSPEDLGFLLDLKPPTPSRAALFIEPPADAPLPPTRLGARSTGVVTLSFDEETQGPISLRATPDVVTFERRDAGMAVTFALHTKPIDGGYTGPVELSVTAMDTFGNGVDAGLIVIPPLVVDLDAPSVSTEPLFVRVPFGASQTQHLPSYKLLGSTEPGALVRALQDDGTELSRARADLQGAFAVSVPPTSAASVAFEIVDEADNRSGVVRSVDSELVLTPNVGTARTDSPIVEGYGAVGPQLSREDAQAFAARAAAFVDADTVDVPGVASFRRVAGSAPPPTNCAASYDEEHAVTLAFGGGVSTFSSDFSESSPRLIRAIAQSPKPTNRSGAGFAYDLARGVHVLFGGSGDTDVWEWDGTSWRSVPTRPNNPQARQNAALVTAPSGVLLLGGTGLGGALLRDAWLRDGLDWRRLDAGAMPLNHVAAAYDAVTQRTLIVTETPDASVAVWSWSGAGFTPMVTGEGPRTADGPFVFDAERSEGHLFTPEHDGGVPRLWTLRDGGWQLVTTAPVVGPRSVGGGAWDPVDHRVLLCGVGGSRGLVRLDPQDGGVSSVTSTPPRPPSYDFGGYGVDQVNGKVWFTGGQLASVVPPSTDVWLWFDGGWSVTASDVGLRHHSVLGLPDGGLFQAMGELSLSDVNLALTPNRTGFHLAGTRWEAMPTIDGGPLSRTSRSALALVRGTPWLLSEPLAYEATSAGWVARGPTPNPTTRVLTTVSQAPGEDRFFITGGVATADDFHAFVQPAPDGGLSWRLYSAPELVRRAGASTLFDPLTGLFLQFGGHATGNVPRADVVALAPNWLDGGLTATPIETSDAERDGDPVGRQCAAWWWDPTYAAPMLAGGRSNPDDQWVLEREQQRPGITLRFPLVSPPRGRSVRLEVRVQASGRAPDGGVADVQVAAWRAGAWTPLPTLSAGVFGFQAPLDLWLTRAQELAFRITPTATNGLGQASISLDAFEVRVIDRR